jgi:hypothetical protein
MRSAFAHFQLSGDLAAGLIYEVDDRVERFAATRSARTVIGEIRDTMRNLVSTRTNHGPKG